MFVLVTLAAAEGTVHLPLSVWDQMLAAAGAEDQATQPPVAVLQVDRRLDGTFRRGVFSGTLTTTVSVPRAEGIVRVPILDSTASIAAVTLDGRVTSLLPEGDVYTVGVEGEGAHTVQVSFFVGRPDDRFDRRLQLRLPAAGPTALSLWVPETDIEADLAQGGITALRAEDGGTRILGQLDGRGTIDLTWKGAHTRDTTPLRSEAHTSTLYTLGDALVRGTTVVDTTVLEGETDHIRLTMPEGASVVDVTGDAVLQWRTDGRELTVLLRYVVTDTAQVRVAFQLPVEPDAPVVLAPPVPEGRSTGAIGVQGPAGVHAEVTASTGTTPLRDLPATLASLTPNPLLLGFETEGAPSVTLAVTRQAEVDLTTTAIDELEAATVIIEDGAEITKLQLHIRNRTRQYLALTMPDGATLTYARIDGRPLRPATAADGRLLVPLIQSEAVDDGTQTYVVQDGDTLGAIADRFYNDPTRWQELRDANRGLIDGENGLTAGATLRVPAGAATAKERRFVVDLVWTRRTPALGAIGARDLQLPSLDAEVGAVAWHVWLPDAVAPLHFGGNLQPYSHLRYDHLRRLRQFLDLAFDVDDAWAGGDSYENILSRRKAIYKSEVRDTHNTQEVTGEVPLVGERYRFERLFPGAEVPALRLVWIADWMVPVVRVLAGMAAALLTLRAISGRRGVLAGAAALLTIAWFVDGIHRSLLLGVDVALLVAISRRAGGRPRMPSLAALLDVWSWRNLRWFSVGIVATWMLVSVPMLWSTALLGALVLRLRRSA